MKNEGRKQVLDLPRDIIYPDVQRRENETEGLHGYANLYDPPHKEICGFQVHSKPPNC
jgi:hypothetical protein